MKAQKKALEKKIHNISLQTQLFLILIIVFFVLIVAEYIIVMYSFNNRYTRTEIDEKVQSTSLLITEINKEGINHSKTIEDFSNNTSSIVIMLTNETGVYKPSSSLYSRYTILVSSEDNTYEVLINDLSIDVSSSLLVSGVFKQENDYYIPLSLKVGNTEIIKTTYTDTTDLLHLENASIKEIRKPLNLNYIYGSWSKVNNSINSITSSITNFKIVKKDIPYLVGYYNDKETYTLNVLYETSVEGEFVLIIFDMVNTKSLVSLISPYYGYFILFSLATVLLIALFISRAFTTPVKTIEGEMMRLVNEDYTKSNHSFRNKELISLQDNLNFVKEKTKERVEEIESQKERVEKLNSELLNENEIRSSFISRLSHELKTPIMVISATTEALKDGIIKGSDVEKEYDNILEEVDKTNTIIKNIISTYRGSKEEVTLNVTRFNLGKLIEEVLSPLLPVASKNGIIVKTNINSQVYMNADRKLIGEVISNFITNAFKYTEKGRKVEINLLDNDVNYIFEVKNYGAHINPENLEKIWLPFYRENNNIDKNSTGMGLYLVRKILSTHNIPHEVTNFSDGVKSYFIIEK